MGMTAMLARTSDRTAVLPFVVLVQDLSWYLIRPGQGSAVSIKLDGIHETSPVRVVGRQPDGSCRGLCLGRASGLSRYVHGVCAGGRGLRHRI